MIESQRKIPTLKLKARVCTLAIKEGGKTENSAKYKSVGFGTRGPCAEIPIAIGKDLDLVFSERLFPSVFGLKK